MDRNEFAVRRIIVPKGLIKSDTTTVIEIPVELFGETTVVAAPAAFPECEASLSYADCTDCTPYSNARSSRSYKTATTISEGCSCTTITTVSREPCNSVRFQSNKVEKSKLYRDASSCACSAINSGYSKAAYEKDAFICNTDETVTDGGSSTADDEKDEVVCNTDEKSTVVDYAEADEPSEETNQITETLELDILHPNVLDEFVETVKREQAELEENLKKYQQTRRCLLGYEEENTICAANNALESLE